MNRSVAAERELNRLKNSHEVQKGERQSPAYVEEWPHYNEL